MIDVWFKRKMVQLVFHDNMIGTAWSAVIDFLEMTRRQRSLPAVVSDLHLLMDHNPLAAIIIFICAVMPLLLLLWIAYLFLCNRRRESSVRADVQPQCKVIPSVHKHYPYWEDLGSLKFIPQATTTENTWANYVYFN